MKEMSPSPAPAAVPAPSLSSKPKGPMTIPETVRPAALTDLISDPLAKDAILAWFRGEFTASNAIIDALCGHIVQQEKSRGGEGSAYKSVFSAIHRRRLNWIPIVQMQKYFPITDIERELRGVMERKTKRLIDECCDSTKILEMNAGLVNVDSEKIRDVVIEEEIQEIHDDCEVTDEEDSTVDDSLESAITETGSDQSTSVCTNHDDCEERGSIVKNATQFIIKELVNGRRVNIVRGLKLYDNIFNEIELSALKDFVCKLRIAGQDGQLSGETFILYNQHSKEEKRELIQLGVPIFGQAIPKEHESYKNVEPIPSLLQSVIDHLAEWNLISNVRKPNSCIINFFDEGEYSPPFLKPPHLEQPISILNLSESTMAFGRTLSSNYGDGDYFKGPLMLSLNKGSLIVMRGNSSEMARHVMCPSPNKRITLSFFRVRPDTFEQHHHHHQINQPHAMDQIIHAQCFPLVLTTKTIPPKNGTGVFLPWSSSKSRKPIKYLTPRAKRAGSRIH